MTKLSRTSCNLFHSRWLIVVAVTLMFAACTTDERTDVQRVADARVSMEKLRFREAIIEMRNLLRKDPKNVEARLILGAALLATGDMETAEKEASRARDLGAPPDLYAETLARALQGSGNHVEVIADIDPDSISDLDLASTLRALRARSMLDLGSIQEADQVFDQTLAGDSSTEAQRIALLGKATIAKLDEDFEQAERLMVRAIDLVPDVPESVLALSRIYLDQGKYELAKALLGGVRSGELRARRQDWFFIEAQFTEALLGLKEIDEARASTVKLESIDETHPMTVYLKGRVEFDSGNLDKAIELFQQTLSEYPNYAPAHTLMGIVMIQREDFDQAEMHLANAVSNNPENVQARRLLAETRMRMGRDEAAVRTLRDGLNIDSTNADLLTMLGRARMRGGEQDAGLEHLLEAYAKTPDSVQSGLALASAYLSSGQSDEAVNIIRSLPEKSIDDKRREILIRVAKLDNNDRDRAERQIEELLNDAPGDSYVIGLAGSFYAATGQLGKARTKFRELLALSPGNRSAMLNILNLDERLDSYEESQRLFELAHQQDTRDLLPALVLARIYEATGQQDRALNMIKVAHESNPTALLPNLMLSAQALRDGAYAEAEQFATTAVKEYPNSARAHALNGFSKMYRGKISESKAEFQRAVILSPDTVQYRYFLGKSAWANGQLHQARTSFENVIRFDPGHLPALRSLGIMHANARKDAQANKLADQIEAQFGQTRPSLVALGEIRAAQGMAKEAEEQFVAAQAIESTWDVALALYQVRQSNGIENAESSLLSWSEGHPEDSRPLLRLAQFHHAKGNGDIAIPYYERVLSLDPESFVTLNNLAWLYFERADDGDLALGLEMAQKAFELSDAEPSIADTYGWLLFKSGRVNDSQAVLRDAFQATSASSDPDIAYHYAAVLEARGLFTSAKTILEDALTAERPFLSRDDAIQLLESIENTGH